MERRLNGILASINAQTRDILTEQQRYSTIGIDLYDQPCRTKKRSPTRDAGALTTLESGEKRKGPIFLHYIKHISTKSRFNVRPVTGELRFLFNRRASPVSERLTHLLKRAATGQNSPVLTQIRCSQRLARRRLQPCGLYP